MANLDTTWSTGVAVHYQAQIGMRKFAAEFPCFLRPKRVVTREISKIHGDILLSHVTCSRQIAIAQRFSDFRRGVLFAPLRPGRDQCRFEWETGSQASDGVARNCKSFR